MFMSAGVAGMESIDFLQEAHRRNIPCVVRQNHLYFPIWWVARVQPEYADVLTELKKKVRESMEHELDRTRGVF
jgi:phytoene/squalene synthetase